MSATQKRLAAAAVLLLYFPAQLSAYIDPGSGSMLLQAFVGGVAAVIVLTRTYWQRITAFMKGSRDRGQGAGVKGQGSRDRGQGSGAKGQG